MALAFDGVQKVASVENGLQRIEVFEHDSFGYSGLGGSRAGKSAYTRFTREKAILANISGQPLLLNQLG